jgi:hypothetical protein
MNRRWLKIVAAGLIAAGAPAPASAQYDDSSRYLESLRRSYQRERDPVYSARDYVAERYVFDNPRISPYVNLVRSSNSYTSNYAAYARPELERQREQEQRELARRFAPPAASPTRRPAASPSVPPQPRMVNSAYYKQFYRMQ